MEFCGMKREIDRKCLIHAPVHANAQSFDRCEVNTMLLSTTTPDCKKILYDDLLSFRRV